MLFIAKGKQLGQNPVTEALSLKRAVLPAADALAAADV